MTRYKYLCICPVCGCKFQAEKSILQSMGDPMGGLGTCIKCNTRLQLTLQEETKTMIATPWDEYIKKMEAM